jgi:hypothetical protein
MVGVRCALAIASRNHGAFLAANVACLHDARPTPAVRTGAKRGELVTIPSGRMSVV